MKTKNQRFLHLFTKYLRACYVSGSVPGTGDTMSITAFLSSWA